MNIITIHGHKIAHTEQSSSILDTIEKHGIPIESQCRSGFCGACRCKLIQGKIKYTQPILAFTERGEILPCCAIPLTDITLQTNQSSPQKVETDDYNQVDECQSP